MYRVTQNKGITYEVNDEHLLVVRHSTNKTEHVIKAKDFDKVFKGGYAHQAMGMKAPVDFAERSVSIPPWTLGVWLGDGSRSDATPLVSNPDLEIWDRLAQETVDHFGMSCTMTIPEDGRCPSVRFVNGPRGHKDGNPLQDALRAYGLFVEKRIPKDYLFNSRAVRMDILAGLIDSDGHCSDGHTLEITTLGDGLADDILFLARSLGFRATHRMKKSTIKSIGFEGVYNRIFITGNTNDIPVVLERKQPTKRKSKINPLLTGIRVEPIGEGEYAGFELEANALESHNGKLFLLSDFTVTHNTSFFGDSESTFIVSTEPGARFKKARSREVLRYSPDPSGVDKRLDFETMLKGLVEGAKEGKLQRLGIKLVVIDSADRLFEFAKWKALPACNAEKKTSYTEPDAVPWGGANSKGLSIMQPHINQLRAYIPVAFTSHEKDRTVLAEDANGVSQEVVIAGPSLHDKPANWLAGEVNLVGHTYKSVGGQFMVKFHSDARLETKDRTGIFEAYRKPIMLPPGKAFETVKAVYEAQAKAMGITLKSRWS